MWKSLKHKSFVVDEFNRLRVQHKIHGNMAQVTRHAKVIMKLHKSTSNSETRAIIIDTIQCSSDDLEGKPTQNNHFHTQPRPIKNNKGKSEENQSGRRQVEAWGLGRGGMGKGGKRLEWGTSCWNQGNQGLC